MFGTLILSGPTTFQDTQTTQQAMQDLLVAYGTIFPANALTIRQIQITGESASGATGSLWVASDPAYPASPDPSGNTFPVSPSYNLMQSPAAQAEVIGKTL